MYITLIVLLAFEAVIRAHQQQMYQKDKPKDGIIFPSVKREHADQGIVQCLQFMSNYGFYKFGLEVCHIYTNTLTNTLNMKTINNIDKSDRAYILEYKYWLFPRNTYTVT